MFYDILKFVLKIALKFFFRTIEIKKNTSIPDNVPLLIVSNHPSTFLDPIVIGTSVKQQLYFLTRGNVFTSPFIKWLFHKLHMIPIYRKNENPELIEKNREIFQKCYELLSQKKAILIFPEGMSKSRRRLQKIRKGTARIALEAEAINDFKLGIVLIPVGINYSNPGMFRSDLFVSLGEPIDISQYFKMYQENEGKAINVLTEHIKECLEKHTIAIQNESLDELVKNIETIYKSELSNELGLSLRKKDEDFQLTKNIVEGVHYFYNQNSNDVENLKKRIQNYLRNLNRLHLKDDFLKGKSLHRSLSVDSFKIVILALLGFPFYLYGVLNNYLPYILPRIIANKVFSSIEYQGPTKFVLGILTFLIFYPLQIFLIAISFQNILVTIIYGITLPLSGFFVLFYWNRIESFRDNLFFISLFYRRSFLISKLIQQRLEIIKTLEKAKQSYFENYVPRTF
jgi:1-acyl-sn-glycerol-3-phosphate acyltransferase